MATAVCNFVKDGTLELEHEADRHASYSGLVILPPDKMMVVDNKAGNVRLHNLQDGRQLAVYKPESRPVEICACTIKDNETKLAVSLEFCGQIEIISVKYTDQTTSITRVKTLDIKTGLDSCNGLYYLNKRLMISGLKEDKICWGIVSITDGHIEIVHNICECGEHSMSFLSTNKKGMVFISCYAGHKYSDNTGVYGYKSSERKFLYQHNDLDFPRGITVDARGFIFVCNSMYPPCVHQLTETGQPMIVHTEGILPSSHLIAIYCDQHYGQLYVTSRRSNVITRYSPEYSDHEDVVIPAEILKMDARSLQIYKEALRGGKEKVYNIRVMVVGQYGVGKTTLTKRLLGKNVRIARKKSTEGIDVHTECSKVSLSSGEWTVQEKNAEQYSRLQRLVKLLNDHIQKRVAKTEQEEDSCIDELLASEEHNQRYPHHDQAVSTEQGISPEVQPTSSQPEESSVAMVDQRHAARVGPEEMSNEPSKLEFSKIEKKDAVIEIIQLVNKNTDKLENITMEYATLAMWDFAGQYVFYTTHQTFLTCRAIYLLVIDLSQQITELIKDDECFLDTEGVKQYKVRDLIEIWMNSIHSCAPSPKSGIPFVIVVGTHVDKIPKKNRQRVINEYFKKLRYVLKDRPTIVHLMDDIAVDNTFHDPNLEELKKRIFELAKQQPHWGEEKPAKWLPLEQAIMTLKASGVKVAPLSLVEEINRSGSVSIEDRAELDLFLRFQHEMGTILYFSIDGLKEKIILDPQWMIDALKSLITAEIFVKKNPAITSKWYEFKEKGKLTHELLDAIWSKEESPEFHDNKDHIIHLMEELNIIARPRLYSQDGKDVKVEDYFLAPCMLRQKTPKHVIAPEPHPEMESSSVLCCVFMGKFLPSPIFHRLLAACLAHWPIAMKKSDNLIFCGCCIFEVDPCHKLTLHHRDYVIFVRVTKMSVKNKTPDSNVCIQVKEFIGINLSKIIGYLCQSLTFEWYIQCPKSKAGSLTSMFPVSELQRNEELICSSHRSDHVVVSQDLLKFWFKDKSTQEYQFRQTQQDGQHPEQDIESDHTLQSQQIHKVKSLNLTPTQRRSEQLPQEIHSPAPRAQTRHRDQHQLLEGMGKEPMKRHEENIVYLQELQRMRPKIYDIYEAVDDRNCKDIRELTIKKGDILLVLNSSRNWWQLKNYKGEVGYAPFTYLKAVETMSADKESQGTNAGYTDKKPSERQLGRLSMHIGHESFHLGLELGLSGADIQQIQNDYPHAIIQSLKILDKWKQQSGDKATLRNLEKAFKNIGINVDIFKSVDTAGDVESCLPPKLLDKQPEDRHLNRICSRIGTGYVHLGVELEVPLFKIDQIIADHPCNIHRQCFEIMKVWRERQTRQATFRILEKAFRCVGIDLEILKQCVS
ncbi:hypothetical protein CHS0354_022993 [Potamilus streckersoni]|uniref:non-specific serine/threonine protein kinase n=1 Tax=Potamilus streckersoni TaxID=2493646 RepID=A0AAE0SBI9_9BIVA|nr:hypothetical protein CHS0354_022993 [Potamilus streckersoni]